MISTYTSRINSLMLANVAAIYNCYSDVAHLQSTFQLF